MKLKEISFDELENFALTTDEVTFHQTKGWAKLKEHNGWKHYVVGLYDDEGSLTSAALLLAKRVPIVKKYMFYSPRGFLIDYHDYNLLKVFTEEVKKFAKIKEGIFIKIDPYVMYKQRDLIGDLVKDGIDNSDTVDNLKKLSYKHFGFNLMQDALQPRWMHTITVKDRTVDDVMKDMDSKTRQILRKNERLGVKVREITRDELPIFKDIMQHTSDRREFVDRPLSYYESMWNALHDDGILKILVAEIDFNEFEDNTKLELEENEKELKDRTYKYENNILKMNPKKYEQHNKKNEENIERLNNQLNKIKEYKEKYGNKKLLGGILFLVYGNEVLSLHGGTLDDVMQFQSAYTIHFAGVKYAVENKYKRYNFYGITGDFRKENPLYGLYLFKKSFGGHVVELIGEFDYIISPLWYKTYKIAFATYHKLKNLKKKK